MEFLLFRIAALIRIAIRNIYKWSSLVQLALLFHSRLGRFLIDYILYIIMDKAISTLLFNSLIAQMISFVLIQIGEAFPVTLKSIGYGFVTGLSTVGKTLISNSSFSCLTNQSDFNFLIPLFSSLTGSILSPYLQNFSEYIHISPLYSLAVVGMLSCISILFSKETFKQPDVSDIPELLENKG